MTATYLITNNNAKKQYYSKMQYNLIRTAEAIDNQINVVQGLGLNFFSDDIIKHYYKPKSIRTLGMEAEQWRIPRLIQRDINIFGNTIDEIYVLFQGDNQVYTKAGVYEEEFFFEQICQYEDYPREFWQGDFGRAETLLTLEPTRMTGANYTKGTAVIPVVFTERIAGKAVFYVANLSSNEITKMLEMGSLLGENSYIVMDQVGHTVIDTRKQDQQDIDTESLMASLSEEKGRSIYKVGKESYQTFSWKGESGWVYVSITPMHSVNQILNGNFMLVVLTDVSLLLLAICLVFIFTQKIYQPINQLKDNLVQGGESGGSGDEMFLVQKGVSKLLEQERTYEKVKKEYEKKHIEHELKMELHDIGISKSNQLEERLKKKYGFQYDHYICCNIVFDFTLDFYKRVEDEEQQEMIEKFKQVLEVLIQTTQKCCILLMQQGNYTCIINTNHPDQISNIAGEFEKMKKIFAGDKEYYTVSVGIGGACTNIEELSVSYNQAMYALKKRSQKENIDVICYDNLSIKRRVNFTFYDQRKIMNCIKIGRTDSLVQIVEEILSNNKECGVTNKNMLELYQQIIAVGQRCLDEQNLKVSETGVVIQIKALFSQQGENVEYEVAKKLIIDYLQQVLVLVNGEETSSSTQLVEGIMRYVTENYMEDMSLDGIGTELGISPKYISRLFKQKTGKNLTDYVSEIRIEKTKEILSSTNIKIGDIGSMVGIESRTTFLRIFKKIEGISPNEYRTLINEKNNTK